MGTSCSGTEIVEELKDLVRVSALAGSLATLRFLLFCFLIACTEVNLADTTNLPGPGKKKRLVMCILIKKERTLKPLDIFRS